MRPEVKLCNSARRHCEVHLGRAPGVLVAHEAAVQGVVDVVGLGHVRHEVGGRAKPVPAGEEELSAGRQVVGAHDVPGVRPRICSPMAAATPPSSGKRTAICRAKAASVTPSLPARRPSTCAMV